MNNLLNMLQINSDVIMIYALIFIMAILLITIFVLDYKSKKRNLDIDHSIVIEGDTPIEKYETYDNLRDSFDEKIEDKQLEKVEEIKQEEPIKEEIIEKTEDNIDSNIKYEEKNEEEKKEEAREELKELVQELKEEPEDKNIGLTDFEVEQEENAIISYDELKKVSDELYENNEETQYKDEGNEPISIAQLQDMFKEINEIPTVEVASDEEKSDLVEAIESLEKPVINNTEILEEQPKVRLDDFAIKTGDHKFKMSPVISPVYGAMEDANIEEFDTFAENTKLKLEQTANLEKLDQELKKTNEFLSVLKELQKKLD